MVADELTRAEGTGTGEGEDGWAYIHRRLLPAIHRADPQEAIFGTGRRGHPQRYTRRYHGDPRERGLNMGYALETIACRREEEEEEDGKKKNE